MALQIARGILHLFLHGITLVYVSDSERTAQCVFRLPKKDREALAKLAQKMSETSVSRVTESDLLREAVRRYLASKGGRLR